MANRSAGRAVLSNNENIQIDKNYLYDWSKKAPKKVEMKENYRTYSIENSPFTSYSFSLFGWFIMA